MYAYFAITRECLVQLQPNLVHIWLLIWYRHCAGNNPLAPLEEGVTYKMTESSIESIVLRVAEVNSDTPNECTESKTPQSPIEVGGGMGGHTQK